jgi:1,4-dihydroxy-6-naphthoate synthase
VNRAGELRAEKERAGGQSRLESGPTGFRSGSAPADRTIRIAHSPDADDAFMFYALATRKISTPGFDFVHVLEDIEILNHAALEGVYEVTACSIHAYPYIAERYALLNCGASMGEGYGPIVVAREPLDGKALDQATIAVPGTLTSAYLALRLWRPEARTVTVPFDRILEVVAEGRDEEGRRVDAGVVIHEGQLTYRALGLEKIVDLGGWWRSGTGFPLPLGGNAIRRDLGPAIMGEVSRAIRESIRYALEHREEALDHARAYGRGLDREQASTFVGMYVNRRTLDYGPDGRAAVQHFLDAGFEAGVLDRRVPVDFVGVEA